MWDQYYNMADELKKHMDIVDLARDAYKAEGLEINEDPVRGGTDGSQLTYMGLPCPNIFAGEEKTCMVVTNTLFLSLCGKRSMS